MPNLQDVVRLFHAECGGAVVGDLEGPWTCSECGAEMRRMVSDFDVVELRPEVSEEVSAYLSKLGKKGGKIGWARVKKVPQWLLNCICENEAQRVWQSSVRKGSAAHRTWDGRHVFPRFGRRV